jgi:hypothetical protein
MQKAALNYDIFARIATVLYSKMYPKRSGFLDRRAERDFIQFSMQTTIVHNICNTLVSAEQRRRRSALFDVISKIVTLSRIRSPEWDKARKECQDFLTESYNLRKGIGVRYIRYPWNSRVTISNVRPHTNFKGSETWSSQRFAVDLLHLIRKGYPVNVEYRLREGYSRGCLGVTDVIDEDAPKGFSTMVSILKPVTVSCHHNHYSGWILTE